MTADPPTPSPRPSFVRRHRTVVLLGAVALVLAAAAVAYFVYLNTQLGGIGRFESTLRSGQRAPEPKGETARARNILLLGTDRGHAERSIEEELADGKWTTGAFRSDTIMLVHVPADSDEAYLFSLPRDAYVPIPGHGTDKINAAFSIGGPDLTVRTVEELTGIYVNHVAMVDWAGFKQLTHAIGGVEVTIPETFTDTKQDRTWEAGTHVLEGADALAYVRTRYGLEQGDFDRINRQQNFLRAVLRKTQSTGALTDPIRFSNLLQAVADATTVDSGWSTGDIRRLALRLRGLEKGDVYFLTAPVKGVEDVEDAGSVVLLAKKEARALWEALREDDVPGYLDEYGGDLLPEAGKVR